MASLETLLARLKVNVQTVASLPGRIYDHEPAGFEPPGVVIAPDEDGPIAEYDHVFGNVAWWRFRVSYITSRASERSAQRRLYRYLSSTGTDSIKLAIETDRTLNNEAHTLLVEDPQIDPAYKLGDVDYYAAHWLVRVLA